MIALILAAALGAETAVHFPAPPPIPAATPSSVASALLPGLLRARPSAQDVRVHAEYKARLAAFLAATPEDQMALLMQDKRESDMLFAARDYLSATAYMDEPPAEPALRSSSQPPASGRRVYSASECAGPVVNGQCHGTVIPNGAYHPTCHGEMLNGMCTGPMF